MCGLAGFLGAHAGEGAAALAQAMADAIRHRGPDDAGVWTDDEAGIALAHRRLSILDLSPTGHQPMLSASGRWVIVYNGEIYNHEALRRELERAGAAPQWRGHSDTETLLACIEAWGVDQALRASVGMFAFAAWDRAERALVLARDRMGEKPLYYGWQGDTFLFGSELKALAAHPAFRREIDPDAVALLLRHNCIPAPWSIWRGIGKLPPGTWLTVSARAREAEPKAYWSLADVAEAGQRDPFDGDMHSASIELERVLGDAVAGQMMADVPLGALLSGGIDSSSIVALMQARSSRPVRTFSIGFHEKQFDESAHAAAVAAHLGTDHTELFMGSRDVLDAVPRMPQMYDEPFADSSQLPTSLVMALARQQVTVALSGDGGDELFGGYNRYLMVPRAWSRLRLMPQPLRGALGRLLLGVSPRQWDRLGTPLARALGQAHLGDKLHKLGRSLRQARTIDDLYLALVNEWDDAEAMVPAAAQARTLLARRDAWPALQAPEHRMMALDAMTYLPDDILVKVDRAAMAASLETRAPFLDHRVVEFAWRLPLAHKIADGQGKAVLRRLLYQHVPRALIERPKVGFGVPLDAWLRTDLRDWAESLLSEQALRDAGLVEPGPVRAAWAEHLSGRRTFGHRLWSVLMVQSWLETGRGSR